MAYLTGSYTDAYNALDLFKEFLLAQGWTINHYSPADIYDTYTIGSILNVQKTINGKTAYFNFRSFVDEIPFDAAGVSYESVTGIACIGSTGYDPLLMGANDWNKHPGYMTTSYTSPGSGDPLGGNVTLDNAGGTYYFFDTGTTAIATFSSSRATSPYQHLAIGVTDIGVPIFCCSGGSRDTIRSSSTPFYDTRGTFFGELTSTAATWGVGGAWDGTGWNQKREFAYANNIVSTVRATSTTSALAGSYAHSYILYSPSPIRGNAPLPPCALNITKTSTSQYYPIGTLDGVYFVNMTNYADGDEITYGADTYKVFRVTTFNPAGVAFRK